MKPITVVMVEKGRMELNIANVKKKPVKLYCFISKQFKNS